jgi:crotonobetaine/carnitine-CoA ligase
MSGEVLDTASGRTIWDLAVDWAARRGDQDFLTWESEHGVDALTWDTVVNEAADLRARLAGAGVVEGRTVVVALPNSPLLIGLWLAVLANAAIIQVIDADSGPIVFERAVRATAPALVVVHPAAADAAQRGIAAAGWSTQLMVVEDGALRGGYDRFAALRSRGTPTDARSSDVAGLLPTSGTSGLPKLVELTHANYVMAAERLARNTGFVADDRHYLCTPFFHTNGQLYLCAPAFVTGGSIALVPRFSAGGYFRTAATLEATVSSMVAPPMRMALHRALETGGPVDPGPLRLIQYGMTMSSADWREWDRLVPQIEMRQIYGQTESVSGVLGGSPWEPDDRVTIGRPFVGVPGVRLVDEDGQDVPVGTPGELWVQGHPGSTLMRGYRDAPEATARTLVDGTWLRTGDVMVRQPNGRFEFRGRQMHIIRRGGENLSTYALEVDLMSSPLVSEVAVTARADDRLDALVVAHVIPAEGYSEEGFLRWCRENLGRRGVPDEVRVHEDFPRTASGRVITRDLA